MTRGSKSHRAADWNARQAIDDLRYVKHNDLTLLHHGTSVQIPNISMATFELLNVHTALSKCLHVGTSDVKEFLVPGQTPAGVGWSIGKGG